MIVDDYIHASGTSVIYDFLNAGKVVLVDGVVAILVIGSVGHPSYRNAKGVKAGVLHALNDLSGGERHAPRSLVNASSKAGRLRVAASLHGVTKVDAVTHEGYNLECGKVADGAVLDGGV